MAGPITRGPRRLGVGLPQAGQVWADYSVEERVGGGGHGHVYRVKCDQGGGTWAMKLQAIADAELHARLIREADILQRLDHENVLCLHEVFEHKGRVTLILELADGGTLSDWMTQTSAPSVEDARRLFRGLIAGVAHAHARGVVHRDIKPSNILLGGASGEVPKLADFGIAKDLSRSALTRGSLGMGTEGYMAPEQARGGAAADPRADIYSLGVLYCELMAAAHGRHAEMRWHIQRADLSATTVMRVLRDCCSAWELKALCAALSEAPEDRPGSCEALLEALSPPEVPAASPWRSLVLASALGLPLALLCARGLAPSWTSLGGPDGKNPIVELPRAAPASEIVLNEPTEEESAGGEGAAPRHDVARNIMGKPDYQAHFEPGLPPSRLEVEDSGAPPIEAVEPSPIVIEAPALGAREVVALTGGQQLHLEWTPLELWVGVYEVTQAQWGALMGGWVAPAKRIRGHESMLYANPSHPAHSVSWSDALVFTNRLSQHLGLLESYFQDATSKVSYRAGRAFWDASAEGCRLLTDEEWARLSAAQARTGAACSAANVRDDTFFALLGRSNEQARHLCRDGFAGPAPVGSFAGAGLRDLQGNVREWAWSTSTLGPVAMGDSWRGAVDASRWSPPSESYADDETGLRVACARLDPKL